MMKRIFAVVLSACLALGVLAGCSGSSASYDVNEVASAVAAVCNIDGPADFTQDDMEFMMNLPADSYDEFAGQYTTTNGASGTVLVVHAASGKAADVESALAAYRDGLVAQFETYKDDFPVGYEQNKAGRVVVKGDYVVLALAGADVDYADVDAAIEEAMP
ncbi:MAG TPA: DUF4358 domain-containing protein [Candidatus Ruthenibacterium merdigallinarum]|nr:DUF4358 domain-containing protein [Candidatus Ruthenibacterium merdigallinarum]